jgi:hypothetical protein
MEISQARAIARLLTSNIEVPEATILPLPQGVFLGLSIPEVLIFQNILQWRQRHPKDKLMGVSFRYTDSQVLETNHNSIKTTEGVAYLGIYEFTEFKRWHYTLPLDRFWIGFEDLHKVPFAKNVVMFIFKSATPQEMLCAIAGNTVAKDTLAPNINCIYTPSFDRDIYFQTTSGE